MEQNDEQNGMESYYRRQERDNILFSPRSVASVGYVTIGKF